MQRTVIAILFTLALLPLWTPSLLAAERPYSITVKAEDFDRHQTPVSFNIPTDAGREFVLVDGQGKPHELQIDANGRATFIQFSLRKRDRANYKFVRRTGPLESGGDRAVDAKTTSTGVIDLSIAGRPVLRYQGVKSVVPRPDIKEIFSRGAYIHPLRSPGGVALTDDYPHNHLHHHGIWWAWTKTEFEGRHPDFWNMGDGTGTVEYDSVSHSWSGPVYGGFRSQHRFVDLSDDKPKTVLNEDWEVNAYWIGRDQKEYWMFDLVSTQRCSTAEALKLPEYRYGGLGFRGHGQWDGADHCFFLTSEGETNRVKAHATKARWCDISGIVDGKLVGVAILGHASNFRAPQPMRVHPDEPFFNFAPQLAGDMELTPDKAYISRYRFIVHDGAPIAARLDQFWNDFSFPPTVDVQYSPN